MGHTSMRKGELLRGYINLSGVRLGKVGLVRLGEIMKG